MTSTKNHKGEGRGKNGSSTPQRTAKRKKAMLEALRKSLGIVTQACKISGVPSRTHYDWLAADPDYAFACLNIKEEQLDFAESALLKQIQEGNTTATIFFLKTQGRSRGYIERRELSIEQEQVFVIEEKQKGLRDTIARIEDANEVSDD